MTEPSSGTPSPLPAEPAEPAAPDPAIAPDETLEADLEGDGQDEAADAGTTTSTEDDEDEDEEGEALEAEPPAAEGAAPGAVAPPGRRPAVRDVVQGGARRAARPDPVGAGGPGHRQPVADLRDRDGRGVRRDPGLRHPGRQRRRPDAPRDADRGAVGVRRTVRVGGTVGVGGRERISGREREPIRRSVGVAVLT